MCCGVLDAARMFTLCEVARRGSITAAATALGYTTSAVSQQIAKLEKEAGQPLLERHARGIALTDAGRSVVKHAERILVELEAADAELAEIRGLRAGMLSIGTFPTAGSSLLPLVVKEFKTQHPGVRLSARLAEKYPDEITIVLQHQFWDLKVSDTQFEVGLSFSDTPERLVIPFNAIRGFYDPSVNFELEFEVPLAEEDDQSTAEITAIPVEPVAKAEPAAPAEGEEKKPASVVSLDSFLKKQ